MEVIYVDMVILGCLIQILIGSSHGLPNGSFGNQGTRYRSSMTSSAITPMPIPSDPCSATTCDDNERCEEVSEHVSFCVCLSNARFNGTTEKCELKYQWVKYTPEMWNDTRLVMFDYYSNPLKVVGRRKFDNDIISVSSYIKKENGELPNGTEVLLIEPGHRKWIRSSNGIVKENAIESGIKGDTIVYVCRAQIGLYNYVIGWMRPRNRGCKVGLTSRYKLYTQYYLLTFI